MKVVRIFYLILSLLYFYFFLGVLTPNLFRDISTSLIGDEWRRLARRLGLTRIRIEAIERDYQDDAPYYMLIAWFKRVSRSADKVLLLINALMNINRWDLAQDLKTIKDEKRQELTLFKDGKKAIYSKTKRLFFFRR